MDDRRAPNTRAIQQTDRRNNAYQRRRSTRPVRCWIGQIPAHVACGTAVCPKSAGWRRNQHPRRRPRFIGSPMPVDADMGGRGQACAVFICSQGPRGGSGRSPAPCIGGAADAGRRAGAASVRRWGVVQAQSARVLVSNSNQTPGVTRPMSSKDAAQVFETGVNDTGHAPSSIELRRSVLGGTDFPTVKPFGASANGSEVATLTGPASAASERAIHTFVTPEGITPAKQASHPVVAEDRHSAARHTAVIHGD